MDWRLWNGPRAMYVAAKLQLGRQPEIPRVFQRDALVIEHLVDFLVGRPLLRAPDLDEIGPGVVLGKDEPIRVEALDQPDVPAPADVALQYVNVFESNGVQTTEGISLSAQKGGKLSKDPVLLGGAVQGVIYDSPLGIDEGDHAFSRLPGNGLDPVDGFLAGLDKARDVVRRSRPLREPQADAIDTALVEGPILQEFRHDTSLKVSRIPTANKFLETENESDVAQSQFPFSNVVCIIK